jgi:hypothetical protein
VTIVATSVLALVAAVAISGVPTGPGGSAPPPLRFGAAARALHGRPLRLATPGYMGHMWELYAVWAWLPAFVVASRTPVPSRLQTGVVVFAAIGLAGLAGSVAAGLLADRVGRTATTSAAMLVSAVGWRYALLPLAAGPLAGTVAMLALRATPAARMLAHGRR